MPMASLRSYGTGPAAAATAILREMIGYSRTTAGDDGARMPVLRGDRLSRRLDCVG
jgi:hypothetical protein